ncbi:hypothetical protein [Cerasicoccus maritimus]|uniref:hypothetical protein n=1 Tax=Cerasicoccus maritimus TaxID=490089 RepID=UPI0028526DD0|nr:hypothetical protein [Cerasicoccus maritimus]
MPHFSDEPNLIQPTGINYRLLLAILAGLLMIGAAASFPLYENWQEDQAHDAVRGDFQGATYEIRIGDQTHRLELGWADNHLAVAVTPALPPDSTIHIAGSFGEEDLTLHEGFPIYGPSLAPLDPYKHYKIKLKIQSGDETLWSGKRWAWGIHVHAHHH